MTKYFLSALTVAIIMQASPVLAGGDCNALCSAPHHSYDDCMRECMARHDAYREGYWPPQVLQYAPPPTYSYPPPQPVQQCWRDQYGRTFCQ